MKKYFSSFYLCIAFLIVCSSAECSKSFETPKAYVFYFNDHMYIYFDGLGVTHNPNCICAVKEDPYEVLFKESLNQDDSL